MVKKTKSKRSRSEERRREEINKQLEVSRKQLEERREKMKKDRDAQPQAVNVNTPIYSSVDKRNQRKQHSIQKKLIRNQRKNREKEMRRQDQRIMKKHREDEQKKLKEIEQKKLEEEEKKARKRLDVMLRRRAGVWTREMNEKQQLRARRSVWTDKQFKRELDKKVEKWEEEIKEQIEKNKKTQPQESVVLRSTHEGKSVDYLIPNYARILPKFFLEISEPEFTKVVKKHIPSKVNVKLELEFERHDPKTGEIVTVKIFISTSVFALIGDYQILQLWKTFTEELLRKINNFQKEKSGWTPKRIFGLHIAVSEYNPLKGGTYVELPLVIKNKKALINMKNTDQECFKWSITRSLNPVGRDCKNPGRISKILRLQSEKLNWTGISFLTTREDFPIFERNNPDISINVWTTEDVETKKDRDLFKSGKSSARSAKKFSIVPLWLSSNKDRQNKVDLFLYNGHYCVVKNLSALLTDCVKSSGNKVYICKNCMYTCYSQDALDNHERYCLNHDYINITYPSHEYSTLKFKNHSRTIRNPIAVCADFEALTTPIDNTKGRKTHQYQSHQPMSLSLQTVRFDGKNNHVQYVGLDAADKFTETIEKITKDFYKEFKTPKPKQLVNESTETETICHICNQDLDDDRVLNHCHYTGKFLGVAHENCYRSTRKPVEIPVFFHNLGGYDERLFLRNLGETDGNISCIAQNTENFISLSKDIKVDEYLDYATKHTKPVTRKVKFLDSMKFMGSSLVKLVDNLDKEKIFLTQKEFPNQEHRELLMRKGVYPYDYVNTMEKLEETSLPPKAEFFSKLSGEDITDEDYDHAKKVWNTFGSKTIRDYHDIYLKSDVTFLSDVFEAFRDMSLRVYGLDPVHYYTAPGLAWDAALKKTGVTLDLFTEDQSEMFLMIESGIRGGISTITHRYAKANNPYMSEYDPSKETSYIQYLDANNLYGWAMSKPLPTGGFKWIEDLQNWNNLHEGKGCVLEVDLEYPKHLHDLHNDLPLAPEKVSAGGGMGSKLIPNLKDKHRYVVHHQALKNILKHGLVLKKIYKAVEFDESPWLKPYIDLNTGLRTQAKNEFEKDFYKLMNNAVFGKTMENIRNRTDIRVASTPDQFEKLVQKVSFNGRKNLSEKMSLVHLRRLQMKMNKPIYVGQAILDISKTLMYDFHYDYIKQKYGDQAQVLFTNTDSLCYHIKTDDFYKDIIPDIGEKFDTSNYLKNHPSGIPSGINKKVIGMFKDEAGGKQIVEFVGLRPKLYSYRMDTEGKTEKRCKGVTKAVVKRDITFEDYLNCVFNNNTKEVSMNMIRSHDHNMFTETVTKTALDGNDDKRVVLEDKISTLAHGHYTLN